MNALTSWSAEKFPRTGPPPDDEDDARIDVGLAFENLDEADDSGEDLVNVEHGTGLAPFMSRAAARYGGASVTFTVQHIKFLDSAEAIVWFTVDIGPMKLPWEGRAILTTDGWKVGRSTLADLLARAGTTIPRPP